MGKALLILLLLALLVVLLAFSRNIMPLWQWLLPTLILVLLVGVLWSWLKIVAIIGGVLGLLLILYNTHGNKDHLVINSTAHTYVLYNNCFLYCNPIVYKKYAYLPFVQYYKKLGEQAITNHRVEGNLVYLEDGIKEWVLGEE